MNQKLTILFISTLLLTFVSCKKVDDIPDPIPNKELEMSVTPYFGSEKLYLDSIYTTDENYLIQFQEVRFYMTNIKSGSNLLTDVAFFHFRQNQNAFLKVVGDVANFSALNFVLGVDSTRNHADPSAFSSANPLNIMNAGDMHWGWNPGYIFMYIDAKIDTIPDGTQNLDHFISFHVGQDQYKQSINFPSVTWTKSSETLSKANLILDLKKFLYEPQILNLKTENLTHTAPGQEVLSQKVILNFANAFRFE